MYDLIIIGGGPAGITAGIYAARKKLKTLLITKDFVGQTGKAGHIENYPGCFGIGGLELMGEMKKHLEKFEIEIKEGATIKEIKKNKEGFDVKITQKETYFTKAVIVASGRDPRPLEVPGEKEFIGKGVSYCVTCDGPLFRDKSVAVVGGGNAGFDAALELSNYCPAVYLLEFGSKAQADEINQEKARATKKIKVILNTQVKEVKGKEMVEFLIYEDLIKKEEIKIAVQGIFIEIGQVPATGFLKDLPVFNEKDEIEINLKTGETKIPGLFAAGDVTDAKYKQIIVAAGEGAKAALSAYEYLSR